MADIVTSNEETPICNCGHVLSQFQMFILYDRIANWLLPLAKKMQNLRAEFAAAQQADDAAELEEFLSREALLYADEVYCIFFSVETFESFDYVFTELFTAKIKQN